MIPLKSYDDSFVDQYYAVVKSLVQNAKKPVILDKRYKGLTSLMSCILFDARSLFPVNFFDGLHTEEECFEHLITAPFMDLKKAHIYCTGLSSRASSCAPGSLASIFSYPPKKSNNRRALKPIYRYYVNIYGHLVDRMIDSFQVNVQLVKQNEVLICPYCNRDYINWRHNKFSGAQLDHFYPKAIFPIFALSLYNLVPCCGNCNRKKSDTDVSLVSPFDLDVNHDLDLQFQWNPFVYDGGITIRATGHYKNNVQILCLEEAYKPHAYEAKCLERKAIFYGSSQIQEIRRLLPAGSYTEGDLKDMIFGENIESNDYGMKSLSKLKVDLLRQLGVL